MSIKKGIGYSPLTEKVYIGKQDKTKGMWVGNDKEDITNDFVNVLYQYLPINTTRLVTTSKDKNMLINVDLNSVKNLESVIKLLNVKLGEIL